MTRVARHREQPAAKQRASVVGGVISCERRGVTKPKNRA